MSTNNENSGKHPRRSSKAPSTSSLLGVAFGIFMFIVYVGMGVLLFINFFDWGADWAWTRWVVGSVLIVYGFFRAYRTYVSIKTHGNTDE